MVYGKNNREKHGSEKIGIGKLIEILQHLEQTTMPSALPVEVVMDDGELREIKKVEYFCGSLGIFI